MAANRFLLTHRVEGAELLDEGQGSAVEARRSLNDLRRLNHWLFGVQATLGPLKQWLREAPKPVTVLDLGTGSGQMAQALALWAAREALALRVVALDLTPRHLAAAQQWNSHCGTPHVHLLAGDALRLPLADGSVDFVSASLFLHHFDEATLGVLLAECRRVARRGLAMSDLWRHPLPFALYKGLAEPLLVRSPVTHYDSSVSFRRSYRPAELAALAQAALPRPNVRLHLPSLRLLLSSRWDGPP